MSSKKSARRRKRTEAHGTSAAPAAADAEAAWRRESRLNEAVLETVGALVVVLDREGRIVRFNEACRLATGYSTDQVLGQPVFDLLIPDEQAAAVRAVFQDLVAGVFPNAHENEWVTKSGARRLIAWRNTAIVDAEGSVEYVVGTGLEVTEHRRAQAELDRNREMLRDLNARVISAQEESSRRLAREMHDGLGQRVTRLAFQVSRLRNRSADEEAPADPALDEIEQELRALGADIRNISHELHPTILQDLGLPAAIERECREFSREHEVHATWQVAGVPGSLAGEVQLALFRIAQESLANVRRHARATAVSLTLVREGNDLILAVRDDGRGFDPAGAGAQGGLGMTSMRERANAVGGRLRVETTPLAGTLVEFRIPLAD